MAHDGVVGGQLMLVGRVEFLPKFSGAGEGVSSQEDGEGQDGQCLVGDRQTSPCCLALCILQLENVLKDPHKRG